MGKNSLLEKGRSLMKDTRLKNSLRNILFKKRFLARLNHNAKSFHLNPGFAPAPPKTDDNQLIERLKAFYLICDANFEGNKDSVWSAIFSKLQGDIHSAFINSDQEKIVDILRNPRNYNFFYGFENLCRDLIKARRLEDIYEGQMAMDSLISLCEAVGVITMTNPESVRINKALDAEDAIELLEKEFGFSLRFPNPFEGEFGLVTKKGFVSYRAIQAIYQAWRISTIVKDIPNPAVLEIGGGLGRTAFYCHMFGIADYTIVDIPMSSLAQGNFLGRTLSPTDLLLAGETADAAEEKQKIKLTHSNAFFASGRKYDLIINVDSLTELDITIATSYLQKINEVSTLFLSINHEINSFSINSIWKENLKFNRLFRYPNWVRRGYAEELFKKP